MSDNAGAVNLGSAYGEILIDYSKVSGDLNKTFNDLEHGLGAKLQRMGDQIQRWGTQFTLATAPIAAFTVKGISAFANFEEILAEIAARTGATAEEMDLVKQTAIKMGAATRFSATEASEAMLQLLSSGSTLKETFIALPHVMNLAAAGTLDLGTAADATTDILAQFRLDISKSEEVVNALAKASGASSATIPDLIAGFSNVGPVAADFGISMEDTAAILAVFAENGIKGAEAGTQLRSMLTAMNRPTDAAKAAWNKLGVSLYDAQGNFRDVNKIILDLDEALADMPEGARSQIIQELAGSYGQMGLSALLASDGIGEMRGSMDEATGAAELAAAKSDTLKGMWESLTGSVETLMFTALEPLVENHIKPLIEQSTGLINKLSEWMTLNPELAGQIGTLLGLLVVVGPTFAAIGTAIGLLFNPIALLVVAGAALYMAYQNNWLGIQDIINQVISEVMPKLESLYDWFVVTAIPAITVVINDFKPILQELIDQHIKLWNDVSPYLEKLLSWFISDGLPFIGAAIIAGILGIHLFIETLKKIWTDVEPKLTLLHKWFTETGLPYIKTKITDLITEIGLFIATANRMWDAISGTMSILKTNASKVFTDILNAITPVIEAIDDVIEKINLAKGLGGAAISGGGGIVGDVIGGLGSIGIKPPWERAKGGKYPSGVGLVGEEGPELIATQTSGMVVANDQLATAVKALGSMFAPLPMGNAVAAGGGSGGGSHLNIENITITVPEWKTDDPKDAGRQMGQGFEEKLEEIIRSRG